MLIIETLFTVSSAKNISTLFFTKYVTVRRMAKIATTCRLHLFLVSDGGIEKGNKVRKLLSFGYLIMFPEKELQNSHFVNKLFHEQESS